MRVFVTGASGFIGQAVVKELLGAGHQVLGLARSDESAQVLAKLGAEVHRGSLDDLESLKKGAAASDGVIHLAFVHDFSDYAGCCLIDRNAIEAIGTALEGSNRPFVITSGTLLLRPGELRTEEDAPRDDPTGVRGESERLARSFISKGVKVMVVRLPPTNHGEGDKGFIPELIKTAREKGMSAYIGDGLNHWPAVHRLDTATVFRLALEKGSSGGIYHAVAEEGIPLKDIALAIGGQLNVPIVSKTQAEAPAHFGWMVMVLPMDNLVSSAKTRETLGWKPVEKSLISDIEDGHYFKTDPK